MPFISLILLIVAADLFPSSKILRPLEQHIAAQGCDETVCGSWSSVIDTPVLMAHASLLPTNQILFWNTNYTGGQIAQAYLWSYPYNPGQFTSFNPPFGDSNAPNNFLVTALSQNLGVQALAASPSNGRLYAASNFDSTLYTIDPRTGQIASVGPMRGGFGSVNGLVFAPDGILYGYTRTVGENGPLGPGFFRVDPATAVATVLTPPGVMPLPYIDDLAFAPDGTLWGSFQNGYAPLDLSTGLLAGPQHTPLGVSITGFAFLPAATVPEPSTVLLLGAGLLGLFVLHRHTVKL